MSAGEGLALRDVTVRFGSTTVVRDVSLDVAPGEVVALVGPSGCGKSTLLRVVAGLERPARGSVHWDGADLSSRPPEARGFGLMFQDHALFPHRTVGENVAFGLRVRGDDRSGRGPRVAEVLDLVGLDGFADRTVDTLSGGEAQRVALARSLAPSPRLLMLDEPLGSLDRSLRDRLALDLRTVLTELGLAAVHVTHDQEEAYAVADRLVVMRAGRIERDGPAAAVWEDPRSAFVAGFLGHPNVLSPSAAEALGLAPGHAGSPVAVVVREAAVVVAGPAPADGVGGAGAAAGGDGGALEAGDGGDPGVGGALRAQVLDVRFRGGTSRVSLRVAGRSGTTVDLAVHSADPPAVGARVVVTIDPALVVPLPD